MDITITTAARRMARETNGTAKNVSNFFDLEGNAFASLPADCNWTTGIPEGAVLLEAVRRYGPFPERDPLACGFIDGNWRER